MKGCFLFGLMGLLGQVAGICGGLGLARADIGVLPDEPRDPRRIRVFRTETNALPGDLCTLDATTDEQNVLTGVIYQCSSHPTTPKIFTVDQVKAGAVLVHDKDHDLDLVSVSAPQADAVHGGNVTVHYLTNGITHSYGDWVFEMVNTGQSWMAYTSPDNGHFAFNFLWLEKKTFFGKIIGISALTAKWE